MPLMGPRYYTEILASRALRKAGRPETSEPQRILRIHAFHKLLATIQVRQLVNQAQPVIDDRFTGIAPGVVNTGL